MGMTTQSGTAGVEFLEYEAPEAGHPMSQDSSPLLSLDVKGGRVATPGKWFGRDLFQSENWRAGLDGPEREQAMLIARAIYVSLGRAAPAVSRATERGASEAEESKKKDNAGQDHRPGIVPAPTAAGVDLHQESRRRRALQRRVRLRAAAQSFCCRACAP